MEAKPLTIEEYDELSRRVNAGELTWDEMRARIDEAGNYPEVLRQLIARTPLPPRNLTLTQEEIDDKIRLYAVGAVSLRELEEYDEFDHYGEVIMGLGRLGLSIPVTPMTEDRKQACALLREHLLRQKAKQEESGTSS